MEVWIDGEADMTLPLPLGLKAGELYFQGARIDSFGEKIACECSGGVLQFKARKDWSQKHLFFVTV